MSIQKLLVGSINFIAGLQGLFYAVFSRGRLIQSLLLSVLLLNAVAAYAFTAEHKIEDDGSVTLEWNFGSFLGGEPKNRVHICIISHAVDPSFCDTTILVNPDGPKEYWDSDPVHQDNYEAITPGDPFSYEAIWIQFFGDFVTDSEESAYVVLMMLSFVFQIKIQIYLLV